MTTSENLIKIRKMLCLNQSEFARALGITPPAISRYETGNREPSYSTVRKIIALAKAHNLTINFEDIRAE